MRGAVAGRIEPGGAGGDRQRLREGHREADPGGAERSAPPAREVDAAPELPYPLMAEGAR